MIQIKITLHLLGPALEENIEQVQRTENRTLWESCVISKRTTAKNADWRPVGEVHSPLAFKLAHCWRPCFLVPSRLETGLWLITFQCLFHISPPYQQGRAEIDRVKLIDHKPEGFMSFCLCWHQGLLTYPFLCSLLPFYWQKNYFSSLILATMHGWDYWSVRTCPLELW